MMIIGPRMILLKPWQFAKGHTIYPGSTVVRVQKIDYTLDMAIIDISGVKGCGDFTIIDVPISEMRKHMALE